MAIIKCKMCGGDLNLVEGASTAECEYCGSVQTVPKVDDEKKLTLFARANRLRAACEFDKAAGIYEAIVADFPEEAEAYWGLVLCKYGIEYVDDPATGKKIPTCHRSSFDSVMEDSDFEQTQENADITAQKVYREEAKQFERIRKGILEVSSMEKPYDIFICYKETDEKGERTLDSVLAQDLYSALTDKGYRVFFSRITLQGKLGEAYEPYIFAALNSAKVMLAVGTCYEYYNAVWVKNEWSRYLKICEVDKSRHLIPCYKNIDPEDMPREFNHLQGADLGKMGAVQDILFNMEKYIPLKKETTTVIQKETVVAGSNNPTTESYLKRAFMFLEDGDWRSADEYCEKVLDIDPENAKAYVGKLLIDLRLNTIEQINDGLIKLDGNKDFERALRFAAGTDREQLARMKELADKKWQVVDLVACLKNIIPQKKKEEARIAQERKAEAERIAREKREEEARIAQERKAEAERIAREKREEEARIAQERKTEAERIAREKREEEARIAREKKAEELRIAREKKREQERIERPFRLARRKHNIKVLLIWAAVIAVLFVAGTVCMALTTQPSEENAEQLTTTAGAIGEAIGGLIAGAVFVTVFCGATIAVMPIALLTAEKKGVVSTVFAILAWALASFGIVTCGFLGLIILIGSPAYEYLCFIGIHAVSFVMLFFKNKVRNAKNN